MFLKLAIATGIVASLAGCASYSPEPEAPPPPTSETPTATETLEPEVTPTPDDSEANFYGELTAAFPEEMEFREVRQSAKALAYSVCDTMDAGSTFDKVMGIMRENVVDESLVPFQTTVVYLGIRNFCPEYLPEVEEWTETAP